MSGLEDYSSSDSEASPASPASPPKETLKKPKGRPSRQKALPSKLKDTLNDKEELECDLSRSAVVLCPQSGKRHTVKIGKLSKEDSEPLTNSDLFKGALLILDYKGKAYPVEFLDFTDKDKGSGSNRGKKSNIESKASTSKDPTTHVTNDGNDTSKSSTSTIEILMKAKESTQSGPQKKKIKLSSDEDEKDTIAEMAKKVDKIEKTLTTLVDLVKNGAKHASDVVKTESDTGDVIINGINIMRLPSRDAYSFALQLLDMLFSKEELASALLFKSKKSDKPALEKEKVEKLLSYVEKRFGTDWDMKTLIAKANQKCRDSKVSTESPNDDRED